MVSKPSKALKKSFPTETVKRIGSALKDITLVVAQHPATLALGIMAGAVIVETITEATVKAGSPERDRLRMAIIPKMGNIYNGAQGLAVAMAAVPIISAVAGAVSSVATGRKAPP